MHYKNGREAKVGDPVVGTTYNLGGKVIAGTLVTLTPGKDNCSCKVGYLETLVVDPDKTYTVPQAVAFQGTEQHGMAGQHAVTYYREDYSQCSNLLHAEDAAGGAQ